LNRYIASLSERHKPITVSLLRPPTVDSLLLFADVCFGRRWLLSAPRAAVSFSSRAAAVRFALVALFRRMGWGRSRLMVWMGWWLIHRIHYLGGDELPVYPS